MRQRIKRAFTKDVGLKILAIVFSFLLWLIVVNIDDPTQTRTFTAVVSVMNDDVLTNAGKLYEIKDGVNTVSFRVTAKRSIIEKLSSSDFTAIADMNYLESEERVPVTISANSYQNYITISSKQNYLYVNLEDQVTSKLVITAKTVGDPLEGVAIENIKCTPSVIAVTGRKDTVEAISSVEALCDISGVGADLSEGVIPRFLDSKGNVVDASALKLSVSTVDVSVDFVNLKSVDIAVKTSGVLPEHLALGSITTDPATIVVKGEALDLNDVTNITIPDTVINLSNVMGSYSTTVDISAYLPQGVTLGDGESSKVTIYVKMQDEDVKDIEVPVKNITFTNLGEGLKATLDTDSINTHLFGAMDVLEQVSGSNITGIIDCSNLSVGEKQPVALHFNPVEGTTVQNVTVTITIVADSSNTEDSNKTESKEE